VGEHARQALAKHRKQKVIVECLHVYPDGQTIVASLTPGGWLSSEILAAHRPELPNADQFSG